MGKPLVERFWEKVDTTGDFCWEWQASIRRDGYGQFRVGTRMVAAHRVSWELANQRPVPEEYVVDHECENLICVRPEHLRAILFIDNVRAASRGNYLKTQCPRGHGDQHYYRRSNGKRECRECHRQWDAKRRKKAANA